jgi:hypothetical protein
VEVPIGCTVQTGLAPTHSAMFDNCAVQECILAHTMQMRNPLHPGM